MAPRRILLIAVPLLAFALLGIVITDWSSDPYDAASAPGGANPTTALAQTPAPQPGVFRASGEEFRAADAAARRNTPVAKDGKGIIRCSIAVSTSIASKLKDYQIFVQEERNPNAGPARRVDAEGKPVATRPPFVRRFDFEADLRLGTPRVDLGEIPFSPYPYRVTVAAAEMDGSFGVVNVNGRFPQGDAEVHLQLTEGKVFSVLLRNQRRIPKADVEVRMVPEGNATAAHRRVLAGITNGAGSVVFENVPHGPYTVYVGPVGRLMAEPQKVRVRALDRVIADDGQVRTQGTIITVPDGAKVQFQVVSRNHYAVPDGKIKVYQIDAKRLYEYKGETDQQGFFELPHLPVGHYQLDVQSATFGLVTKRFKIEKDQQPLQLKVHTNR